MSLLGLLVDSEAVFIVELDSVLMLLDDSTDDASLEAFIDEVLLDDLIIEFFLLGTSLELFAELLIELDLTLELEIFFDEALLDDLIIELFLLDALLELFTGRLPPR